MKNQDIAKTLSLLVIVISFILILSLVFNLNISKFFTGNEQIKLTIVIPLLISGVIAYSISKSNKNNFKNIRKNLSILTLLLIAFELFSLYSVAFVKQPIAAVEEVKAETTIFIIPSIPTVVAFILVAIVGIFKIFNAKNLNKKFYLFGALISLIGGVAALGHITNISFLYYSFIDVNNFMEFYTSLMLIMLGATIILLGHSEIQLSIEEGYTTF